MPPKSLAPVYLYGKLSKDAEMLNAARMGNLGLSSDKALPLVLPRASYPKGYIEGEAERIARQMEGEHVTSGLKGDTTNLSGKSMREAQRVKNIPYSMRQVGTIAPTTTYVPKKGEVRVGVLGDQTASNSVLDTLHGEPINSNIEGGALYGLGAQHLAIPEFWKSGHTAAKGLQDKVNRLQMVYDPDRIVGSHVSMGPTSNNFAMHLADAFLRSVDYSKMTAKEAQNFDSHIAHKFKEWVGINYPEEALKQMRNDSELRKHFNAIAKTPSYTQPLKLPNGLDIQYAISEPALRDMEIGVTGMMNGQMVPFAPVQAGGKHHGTYGSRIEGETIGPTEHLEPFTIAFPDVSQHVASNYDPKDFHPTVQKLKPHQVVDEQYINDLGKYHDQLNFLLKGYGKAEGGPIHMGGGGAPKGGGMAILDAVAKLKREADEARKMRMLTTPIPKPDAHVLGMQHVLPLAIRDANKAVFMAKSADPQRYYHGTKANIQHFKPNTANATFLTPEPDFAGAFALEQEMADVANGYFKNFYDDKRYGANILPVRAQVKNPFDATKAEHLDALEKKLAELYAREPTEMYQTSYSQDRKTAKDYLNQLRKLQSEIEAEGSHDTFSNWSQVEHPVIQDAIKQMGHDAFYALENGHKNLAVYDPRKIKSDIGNRGTYDTMSHDINESHGGYIHG